jgi:hypothetical protein
MQHTVYFSEALKMSIAVHFSKILFHLRDKALSVSSRIIFWKLSVTFSHLLREEKGTVT